MDLSTNYLGLRLSSPLMPGASPLVDDLDAVKRLEDAGASAIVMHSLFEEQITGEKLATIYHMELYAESYSEALSYFPKSDEFALGPDQYLEQIRRIKIDPHSPGRYRCDGAASNQAAFYGAFGVKPGDGMYLPPERRVSIW